MPSDAAQGQAPDVHAFDNAMSQALERQAARLRHFETLGIRNEVEVKERKREYDSALAHAQENFGTSDLAALRGIAQDRMATAKEIESRIRGEVDEVEREYNLALSGDTDQQA